MTLVAVALPSFGNGHVDAAILCLILLGVVTIHQEGQLYYRRKGTFSRDIALPVLLVLPVFLALVESAALGGNGPIRLFQPPSFYFISFVALFGYLEEAVFRGGVQMEMTSVVGGNPALLCGAVPDAGFMAFWGSYTLVVYTFFVALLMGFIYKTSGSFTLMGAMRAIEASWFMVFILALA